MLGFHFVNNIDPPLAANYLIIRTDFLYAGTHFHADHPLSAGDTLLLIELVFAVSYPTLRQIVRSQFYLNAVSWHQADVVLPHAAGDMSYDLMAVFELDPKLGSG
jgi:hypothetical protein